VRGFRRIRNIDVSLEGGGFAEYWPAHWLRSRVEVRDSFVGANGVVADLSADFVGHPFGDRWTATAGPRLSLADDQFMASYFGVTSAQSAKSGLA
ncbi:MipA/OmpV family protein, partial [Acinetobacter baumannii]